MHHTPGVSRTLTTTMLSAGIAATALISACSGDSVGVKTNTTPQISFSTTTASGAAFALAPLASGKDTLNLDSVIVTVTRAELKRAKSDNCAGDRDDDGDDDHPRDTTSTAACGELKIGPVNVPLPLDTSVVSLPAKTIPPGTYREFDLRVSRVVIKGTFDTTAFNDTIPIHERTELEFSTPLVVADSAPTSITINIPVKDWFVNPDGTLLNPAKLTPFQMDILRLKIFVSMLAYDDHGRRHDH